MLSDSRVAGITSTGSKRPDALFGEGYDGMPRRMQRSAGARVWDENGTEYLDFVMALGAVALGYGHPDVNRAVHDAVDRGAVGPLPPIEEAALAEELAARMPLLESVRFLKTGAEAVAAAVRLARVHTGRDMVLWNGACMVHEIFSLEKIMKLRIRHPKAKLIAHPECEESVLKLADFVGSTTGLLKYTEKEGQDEFIVATETGILHQMQKSSPHKTFIPAPPNNSCACNDCPHMKLNTLEKLYINMKYEMPEILMDEGIRLASKKPIDKMLEISKRYGL